LRFFDGNIRKIPNFFSKKFDKGIFKLSKI